MLLPLLHHYYGTGGTGGLPVISVSLPLFAHHSISTRGEAILRAARHDPSGITPEVLAGCQKPLQAENWDRALWELALAGHGLGLEANFDIIQIPVLVVTDDDDRLVPTEQSVRLAAELPNAEWVVIPAWGHVLQEECPEAFLQAVRDFLVALP